MITDPDLRRLFDYWRERRRGRLMPAMRDIDPLDIGWALSRIYLVDYSKASGFVYRLAGTEVAAVFGHANLKGVRLQDFLPPERAAPVERKFHKVVDNRCIMWMKGHIYLRADRAPIGERLLLPLSDAGDDEVTGILGMTVIHPTTLGSSKDVDDTTEAYLPVKELP